MGGVLSVVASPLQTQNLKHWAGCDNKFALDQLCWRLQGEIFSACVQVWGTYRGTPSGVVCGWSS
jgi:hypothetical protein